MLRAWEGIGSQKLTDFLHHCEQINTRQKAAYKRRFQVFFLTVQKNIFHLGRGRQGSESGPFGGPDAENLECSAGFQYFPMGLPWKCSDTPRGELH